MSNLGWYQWFTATAKKVGGPLNLMAIIAVGGYAVIRTGETGIKKGIKLVKKHSKNRPKGSLKKSSIYRIKATANIAEGVDVKVGDKIRVCAIDNEVVMIEILGNINNPYFIDFHLLKSIIDYKKEF